MPAPLVAVTRPREAAEELVPEIEAKGWRCLVEPLLEIVPEPPAAVDLSGVQGIILTSGHAVPALARLGCDLPLLAVGEATAAAASSVHGGPMIVAGGSGRSLADLVMRRLEPGAGALLHLAGRDVRPEPAASLAAAGFEVRRTVVYRAEAAERLSPALLSALEARNLAAVMLFSPRTAATLRRLVSEAGLNHLLADSEALCLSRAVAEAAADLPWRACRVAAAPGRAHLVGLLDGVRLRC